MGKETFHLGGVHQFVRPTAVGGVCFSRIRASFKKEEMQFYAITIQRKSDKIYYQYLILNNQ
jgi:hypothetical protein